MQKNPKKMSMLLRGNMENVIIILVLVLIIGSITFYLYRAKKKGLTCIGCPYAKSCGGKCRGNEETTAKPKNGIPKD